MRILESAPHRYELGMRWLTLGRIDRAYDALAGEIDRGEQVLELGCGTGALTRRVARRGASVKGLDVNPEMLAVARTRLDAERLTGRVTLVEAGVADLDEEPDESYDVVVAGLCLSELSADELAYGLGEVTRILRPGGRLLVADEIRPARPLARILHAIVRAPLVLVTYLITQQSTHALRDLPALLPSAGLELRAAETSALGSFGTFVAVKAGRSAR
jgi:ubiquinone/menaquinone biosynthesis C-methylase UbiE